MMVRKKFLLLVALLIMSLSTHAQYYSTGQSASNIKWRQREFSSGKLVYPDYFEREALRMQMMYDSLYATINYGLRLKPLKMPVVVHTENVCSNGLVMFAPKRSELLSIPDINNYASEWYAHLIAHEYRHAVQYANLSSHFFKPLSWLIGQQSGLISLAMMPLWYLEGDAVMAETQAASVGRALQPSFTIAYRAYLDDENNNFSNDKWFSGSYKDNIPSHYHLGYQLVRYGNSQYGEQIWNKLIDYSSRHPYFVVPKTIALKKYYNSSSDKLLDQAMTQMQDYWKSLPPRENSSTQLAKEEQGNFTTYNSPMAINDSLVYVIKTDYDRSKRLVAVDPRNGAETKITYLGWIYTPLSGTKDTLLWTQYKQSLLWTQKVGTQICYYDTKNNKFGKIRTTEPNPMYPEYMDDVLVYFSYDYSGAYSLVVGDKKLALKGVRSVHGMAYDQETKTLAAIILTAQGMSIVELNTIDGSFEHITQASRVTISNLSAGNSMLTFGSIASGYDEVHTIDLETGIERRLTSSRYGSFYPSAPTTSGRVYLSSYSKQGYILSYQHIDKAKDSIVSYSVLPKNVVNLPVPKWDIANIDSLSMNIAQTVDTMNISKIKSHSHKYSKTGHLINIHSWFPLGFNPYNIVEESSFDFAVGATIMSQNSLSTLTASSTYKYTELGHSISANILYEGLPVKLEAEVDYGGGDQLVYGATEGLYIGELKPNLSAYLRAYMPMYLSSDYHNKTLTPIAEYSYMNAKGYIGQDKIFSDGVGYLGLALSYSDYVRTATRDILPRWGYFIQGSHISTPNNINMGHIYALITSIYTPSFTPSHSIKLSAAIQTQSEANISLFNKSLYPRGANYELFSAGQYFATNLDYQLPIAYPDWGINSIVYFKRLRLGMNVDYARFSVLPHDYWNKVWSYGATLYIDMHPLRIPVNITTFSFSIYKPSDSNGVSMGVNLSLPL